MRVFAGNRWLVLVACAASQGLWTMDVWLHFVRRVWIMVGEDVCR